AGAAGIATCRLLLEYGFRNVVVCDREGALCRNRKENMNRHKKRIARVTNPGGEKGLLKEIIRGKDVFIGVSSARVVTADMVRTMNRKPVVLALANPVPEILPKEAVDAGAAFALDGRTVNNCLAFPGLIRGALDARAARITTAMKIRAAETIAALAGKHEGVPNFMNLSIHRKIANAVRLAALETRV
ncbi:MAG TPA: NAD-dependent malic enzyme, partial [Syntrophales bacterium]|nr:NAD-dependent malic enzyme [Syntrophales bacterium]